MDGNDVQYLKYLIKEYETIIPSLNDQIKYYKESHASLKQEILSVDEENKALTRKLEEVLNSRDEFSGSYKYTDMHFIENLKGQLSLSIKEKDSVSELWKTSLRRIDCLENELKLYSAGTINNSKALIAKLRKMHDKQIKLLNLELKKSQTKLEATMKISEDTIRTKNLELEEISSTQRTLAEALENLKATINEIQVKHKAEIEELMKVKTELEEDLKDKSCFIEDLKAQNYNSKLKVAEACHITEAALIEKDSALLREKAALEETNKLTKTLTEILEESEEKIKREINTIKENFKEKLGKVEGQLQRVKGELESKKGELRKKIEMYKKLEVEGEKMRRKMEEEKEIEVGKLLKKIEDGYNQLRVVEGRNTQLYREVDSLRQTIEQIGRTHEIAMANKEMEKRMLEAKTRNLQNELEVSNLKLVQFGIKVEELNEKVKTIDVQMQQEYEIKTAHTERLLKEKVKEIELTNQKINKDLRKHLQSQIALNHKWKSEVKLITEKLEKRIQELKVEVVNVKKGKKKLEEELKETEKKCKEYKQHLVNLCQEFNEIAEEAV